ncbi:hypothetical protein ACM39_09380 [Chryseobacterium sp. FH2]|nr:hypothetical protein ACM39_09380 [Chryseobacterium sp. FH2]
MVFYSGVISAQTTGNVGINMTDPKRTLDVNGDFRTIKKAGSTINVIDTNSDAAIWGANLVGNLLMVSDGTEDSPFSGEYTSFIAQGKSHFEQGIYNNTTNYGVDVFHLVDDFNSQINLNALSQHGQGVITASGTGITLQTIRLNETEAGNSYLFVNHSLGMDGNEADYAGIRFSFSKTGSDHETYYFPTNSVRQNGMVMVSRNIAAGPNNEAKLDWRDMTTYNYKNVNAAYTLLTEDQTVVYTASGIVITLPASVAGKIYTIANDIAGGSVNFSGTALTENGIAITSKSGSFKILGTGTKWIVIP